MLELIELDNSIKLDIRYARHDNFVGRPVYMEARAFLKKETAMALLRVNENVAADGYGVVVFDAYRPLSVTKLFWETATEDQKKYVADPTVGSRHNRGCAVDLSLYHRSDGEHLEMPSDFDEFNEKAHPDFRGGTALQRQNRDYLRRKMETEGFDVNPNEWWHFDHKDWSLHEIMDIPFGEL